MLCRKAKLTRGLRLLCGELFCRKPQTTGSLRCTELSFCALGTQGPGKLSGLLGPALLRLESGLSALRSGFKTLSPELSRGPRLLLQYIPLKLCFLNPLSRAAKGPGAHCLSALPLSCDFALATDVRQRLVNDLLLVRAHELGNLRRIIHPRRAGQTGNALLGGGRPHAAGRLELAGGLCRDASGTRTGLLCLLRRRTCRASKTTSSLASELTGGGA